MAPISATYRIQLNPEFTFDDLSEITDYLARLGISHVYLSPVLKPSAGSTHGYDVADPKEVNPALGGQQGFRRLQAAVHDSSLGLVLDIVPNHMAVSGRENRWWWDVLENGPSSLYASYFDVDWDHPNSRFGNKVLLPVLGDHYGRVLGKGEIEIKRRDAEFFIAYYENEFPVAPRSLQPLLEEAANRVANDELRVIADSLDLMPLPSMTEADQIERRHRMKAVLGHQLARLLNEQPTIGYALDEVVNAVNNDEERLHEFLEGQNFRLSYWRASSRDLGYRRFFDINDLIGIRVENPEVFQETHELILAWIRSGVLDGLRVDHPDGMRNPHEYLERLRQRAPETWIVVEKILHRGESLPAEWPVDGTTGYDFLEDTLQVLIDPNAEDALTKLYEELTGEDEEYEDIVREKKIDAVLNLLGSDLARLTELLLVICEERREFRDYTRDDLRAALTEFAVSMPVYRTYVEAEAGRLRSEDKQIIEDIAAEITERRHDLDNDLISFLRDLLLLRHTGPQEGEFVMRFQQFTGPVMAKGVEDTTFYTYLRFPALNEVGSNPRKFGLPLKDFHEAQKLRHARHPNGMLTTSTHDTKRSEDVRARLAVLSEIPERWGERVRQWFKDHKALLKEDVLDARTLYLLFQTLVGTWPINEQRLTDYMMKAVREAKDHTSWTRQNEEYEAALAKAIQTLLKDESFIQSLEEFVGEILPAAWSNSLGQMIFKMTCPGIPDIYQGTELWDGSLVDPDNRRPVDYARRLEILEGIENLGEGEVPQDWDSGAPKMFAMTRLLHLRRNNPQWFTEDAAYIPLTVTGPHAESLIAFRRGTHVLVMVQRLSTHLSEGWGETTVDFPAGQWRDLFTGVERGRGPVSPGELFARFPAAVFVTA